MTREQFENREVPESLLAYLRCKTRWAAGSPVGYVRMRSAETATWNGKRRGYQKGEDLGIETDIGGDDAAAFLQSGAAEVLPTVTIRVLSSVWPGGIGTNIPAWRLPRMKNTNGVEVEPPGAMVEPGQQFYRGELVLHSVPLPLKAPPDYVDRRIQQSLDFGMIEVRCRGRLLDDPAKLATCPLPERRKPLEGNPNDRRAHRFREMKAGPIFGYDSKTNLWHHVPA
jgi:hypothetical protein